MTENTLNNSVDRLFDIWQEKIPLVTAMQIEFVQHADSNSWCLRAPLAPNSNHMGTAFGGSISVIATLAGWAQAWLITPEALNYNIVVAKSCIEYAEPGISILEARTNMPSSKAIDFYWKCLKRNNRASLEIESQVSSSDQVIANFSGKYVASSKLI